MKKNWKWILFPIGILLAMLTLGRRRKINVVAPELLGAADNKRKANEEAAEQLEGAQEDRLKRSAEIEKEHAMTMAKLTRDQRDKLEELREDPDELNSFLVGVGDDIRDKSR